MHAERFCPDCGLALPSKEEGAGCLHCLLRLAMGDDAPEAPGGPDRPPATPRGLRSRFFGDYEILSELARGGMGVIYRARQISLNRIVALKMIQPGHLPSPEAWLRFQTEIAASAQLNHPHIVALHESGTVDGAHFFTMRLLEGGSLASRLAGERQAGVGTPPPTARASREAQLAVVRMLIQIARAVHYAHQRGVLHRDLKPSNILLDEQGQPHVADFGLAKMLANESAATLTESILGSPNYMAPEQADGRGRNFTVETDVYGLGAILYETLTRTPPFQARTPVETIRKVLDDEPAPPRKLNPGIDADLETICLKCLQKIPGARYGSAEEFAADLERWSQGRPIVARPVGPLGTALRWGRRHPALATVSALFVVLLIAGTVGATLAAMRIRHAERRVVAHLRESLVDQARLLNRTGDLGRRGESLRLLREAAALGGDAAWRARARDEALAALAMGDMAFHPTARITSARPEWALLDPGMDRMAQIIHATNLVVQRLADERILQRIALGSLEATQLEAFSPDGRYLATRVRDGLAFCDTRDGRLLFATNGPQRLFCFATHAPQVLLEESHPDRCEVSIRELPSFRVVGRIASNLNPSDTNQHGWGAFSLSPDGSLFIGARYGGETLELIDVHTGRIRWARAHMQGAVAFAWQPARRRVVAALSDGTVMILRAMDGATMARLACGSAARHLALDEESSFLAVACEDRRLRILHLNSLRLVFEAPSDSHRVSFDADGTRLATVVRGDAAGYFELARSRQFRETLVAATTNDVERCVFTPDGRFLTIGHVGRIALLNYPRLNVRSEVVVGALPVFALDPRAEELLTSTVTGVTRRPLSRPAGAPAAAMRPSHVIRGSRWRALAYSADGDLIWAANAWSNRVFGFTRDFASVTTTLGPHTGVDAVAPSPDGRWLVTGSSATRDVKVWDTATGTNVATFRAGRQQRLEFSADGRWLLVHGDAFSLREAGTWQPARPLPFPDGKPNLGPAAFSADARLLAVVENQFDVRLFDLGAWTTLGLLHTPTPAMIHALTFSPDGHQILAACAQGRLRQWDLPSIRQELAALGLDWDLPPPLTGSR